MADAPNFKTIGEKYESLTAGKRQRPHMIWLQNTAMDKPDSGNFTLVEVPEAQFNKPKSPWKAQGYTRYSHVKPAPAPVEAKVSKQ